MGSLKMVIVTNNTGQFKMNIRLKSGMYFEGMNISNEPLASSDYIVSFWYEGAIRIYPLQDVEYYELIPDG